MKTGSSQKNRIILSISILLFILMPSFCQTNGCLAQNKSIHLHFQKARQKKVDIHFKMIHNLIIIPVFINGSDTLHFILDTGVSHTMITSMKGAEGISFNFAREIDLFGLGEGGEVKAYHSFGNIIELPDIIGFNHNVIILKEEFDYLSQGLGTKINGLIGYDVFDSFTVEIDYKAKKITLYDPQFFEERRRDRKMRKWESVDMEIHRRKPYVIAQVTDESNVVIEANLLVDSGASHAISLFKTSDSRLQIPDNSMYTFIGVGLSGEIYGYIGRVKRMMIGSHRFKRPLVTFPDDTSVQLSDNENDRNGSLGADILNRFNVIFDYHDREMLVRANSNFKNEFKYNLSGLDITTPIPDIPLYQITKVRKGSPAWIAGLEEGDQIITINGLPMIEYTLSNVVEMLQSKAGKRLVVGIRRNDEIFMAKFTLEDPIK